MKTSFTYVVLRYMHDVFTREFVNVGILIYAPSARFLRFRRLPSLDRVKRMFPGLQSDSLQSLLTFLESRSTEIGRKCLDSLNSGLLSAETVAKQLLPPDDSALQWSTSGGGVAANPEQMLNELFERLVTRHEKAHPAVRRKDVDVWEPFKGEFRRQGVLHYFQEKILTVGKLHHRFETTWRPQGGYLRLLQPLSFDLIEPSEIVEKAVDWSGLLRQFRKTDPDFYIYLLLGKPSDKDPLLDKDRWSAFEQARQTLEEEGGQRKELVPEEKAAEFAGTMAEQIRTN